MIHLFFSNVLSPFRDIEKTGPLMSSFRRFLVTSLDRNFLPLHLSSEALALLFDFRSELELKSESKSHSQSQSKSKSGLYTESVSEYGRNKIDDNEEYGDMESKGSNPCPCPCPNDLLIRRESQQSSIIKSSGFTQETLLNTSGLVIHVVAGGVWPAHLLYATAYSTLIFPKEITEIKKEFEKFFILSSNSLRSHGDFDFSENYYKSVNEIGIKNESENENENENENDKKIWLPNVLLLQGAAGQNKVINGEYSKMIDYMNNSEPIFVSKLDGKWIIVYSKENQTWQVKSKAFMESSSQIAFCKINYENDDNSNDCNNSHNNSNNNNNDNNNNNNINNNNNNNDINNNSNNNNNNNNKLLKKDIKFTQNEDIIQNDYFYDENNILSKNISKMDFLSEFHFLIAYSNIYVVSTVMSVLADKGHLRSALLLTDSHYCNALDIALRRGEGTRTLILDNILILSYF